MSDSSGSNKGMGKVISAKSQTAYERWEAPNVKTLQQQKREQAGLVTARQLEDLQQQAYEEGLRLGKEEGYKTAFEQGHEEGKQQGLQEGQKEVSQIIRRFEQIMQFLTQPLEQVNQSVEEELLALSIATARQIIRREITINRGQIVAVIKEAILALPAGATKIKVFLHPADAEIVRKSLQLSSENSSQNDDRHKEELWSVIEEPVLTRGGCRIETEASQIDATIETRLAEIAAKILGSERATVRVEEKESGPEPENNSSEPENNSPEPENNSPELKESTSSGDVKNEH